MRFDSGTRRVIDQNEASFPPNLEQALALRSKIADNTLETNNILAHIEKNPDWFHLGRKPWVKIEIAELNFPKVTFNADQSKTYTNLDTNNVYFFSLGNFAIKGSFPFSCFRKMWFHLILSFNMIGYGS